MMDSHPQDDTFAVLARLASDPKGTQKRLQELAAATHKAESAKREADVAVKQADSRTKDAETKEVVARRRVEQANQAEADLAKKSAAFDERERVYKADTTKTRRDLRANEASLTQREGMLAERAAEMKVKVEQAESDLAAAKTLKDKFISKLTRIEAIGKE